MLGEIEGSGSVGGRFGFDDETVFGGEGIGDGSGEGSGVTLITVRTGGGEAEGGRINGASERSRLPNVSIEPDGTTVKVVGRVVDRENVGLAVKVESPAGDSAGHPPGDGTKIGVRGGIVGEVVEAENYVSKGSFTVGNMQRFDDGAVGDDFNGSTGFVRKSVSVDRFTRGKMAK